MFADLRFPEAVEREATLRLAHALNQVIELHRQMWPKCWSDAPKVSELRHYKLAGFSLNG